MSTAQSTDRQAATAEVIEAQALRDHLAAELDAAEGTSEAINRLVARFVEAERKYRDISGQSG